MRRHEDALVKAIVRAIRWKRMLDSGEFTTTAELAEREGIAPSDKTRVLPLGDVNVWSGKLTLVVEPRITDESWFLFADPARLPCLAYAYLSSAQGVQIQRADSWDTLGLKFRAFLDFGAGWTDWRGAYLNQGGS